MRGTTRLCLELARCELHRNERRYLTLRRAKATREREIGLALRAGEVGDASKRTSGSR